MPLGPRLKTAFAAAAATLALLPASAFAQGAGDDQYSDPFGEEQAQPTATPRAPAATPAPAQPAPAQPAPAAAPPGQPAPPPAAASSGPTLPYTGFEDWLVAGSGALLLGAGLTLRAKLRDADRRT
jgi:hypothetical protein